jgi:cyclopropane fatty-acyl-phospholipid synthase-like methyltransferase
VIEQHPAGAFDGTCTAPAARSDRMRDIVLAHVSPAAPVRGLDLGCGTGSLLFRLAEALPAATLIGVDVSPANVHAAQQQQAAGTPAARVRFEVADYLTYRAEPFDVIVTDGVLHVIAAETGVLVRKLAHDLRAGGLLMCNMPFDCRYNRTFSLIRRALRRVQSPWVDRRILQVGRLLHGRDMDENGLRERVAYMYMPPARMMDVRLARCFASAGLERMAGYPTPNTSLSQLRHRVTVFVRRDA